MGTRTRGFANLITASGTGFNTPAFLATRNSTVSLTTSTWTKIPFSTEVFDTNSNYDPTTNNYEKMSIKYTAPGFKLTTFWNMSLLP